MDTIKSFDEFINEQNSQNNDSQPVNENKAIKKLTDIIEEELIAMYDDAKDYKTAKKLVTKAAKEIRATVDYLMKDFESGQYDE